MLGYIALIISLISLILSILVYFQTKASYKAAQLRYEKVIKEANSWRF